MSRSRTRLATAALALGAIALASPLHAQCIPMNFPGNWLQQQENAGGHTIARHVGKTDLQLAQRLAQNPHIAAASTYPNLAGAQGTITAGLATNRNTINNWANGANNGQSQAYNYAAAGNIGRVATRNPNAPPPALFTNTCTYRAVIRATGGGNCYLLTSFPTSPAPGACP